MTIVLLEGLRDKGAILKGLLPKSPGADIKEFLVTILGEAKRPQI
ncbi:MAG: hypothetical protein ACE5NJ_05530 [Thermodesulfobacteriota bacterium]